MNERFRILVVIILIIAFVFGISVCCFASTNTYGGFRFAGFDNNYLSLWQVNKFLYRNFGRVNVSLTPNGNYYAGDVRLIYRPFGRSDSAGNDIRDFLGFISQNSIALLLNYFDIGNYDYYHWDTLDSSNTVHWQMNFTASQPISSISVSCGGLYDAIFTNYNSNVSWAYYNDGVYTIDLTINAVNGIVGDSSSSYPKLTISTSQASSKVQSITFDNSLNPYWEKNGSGSDSQVITNYNVYNIGSDTDLSVIYQYLDIVTEWLNLLQETQGDTLDTLLDFWTDMQARLSTVNNQLNLIRNQLSTISGNTSSILSICAAINDRVQACMNALGNIEEYSYEMETLQEDYLPYLYDIYEILQDIEATLEDFEQKFVDWTATQYSDDVNYNMKHHITKVFDYVRDFFWSAVQFLRFNFNTNPFSYIFNFNGSRIWGNS